MGCSSEESGIRTVGILTTQLETKDGALTILRNVPTVSINGRPSVVQPE